MGLPQIHPEAKYASSWCHISAFVSQTTVNSTGCYTVVLTTNERHTLLPVIRGGNPSVLVDSPHRGPVMLKTWPCQDVTVVKRANGAISRFRYNMWYTVHPKKNAHDSNSVLYCCALDLGSFPVFPGEHFNSTREVVWFPNDTEVSLNDIDSVSHEPTKHYFIPNRTRYNEMACIFYGMYGRS